MGIFLCTSNSCYANSETIRELPAHEYNNQINQAQFETALKWAAEGRLHEANDLLINLYHRTKSPRVLLEGARVLYLAGEHEEAEILFKQVLELKPPMMVRERVIVYLNNIAKSVKKTTCYQL
jgi:tetratricopeptide (TPR) repeat protein